MLQFEPAKDPDEVLDYAIDWTDQLAIDADEIQGVTWTFPSGLTKASQDEAEGIARVFISGGAAGQRYEIGHRMVTAGGRTYDRTVTLAVRQA